MSKNQFEFGILNIDKPSGPTSFSVSDYIKKKFGLRKTSHFGTLDPKVTGVLPIALNRACKLTGYFIGHDKEYVGIMRFHKEIDKKTVESVIKKKFLGKIKQTPPVKSRVKRQERIREIKEFVILEQSENKKDFVFRSIVQGGTYIRKLIDDLGKELGIGAHMLELRRTRAGIFKEKDSITLYDLEKMDEKEINKKIIPSEKAIKEVFPEVQVKKEGISRIFHGSPIHDDDLKKKEKFDNDTTIAIFSGEQFVGMFKVINARNIFAKSEFTFQPIKI